MAQQNPNPDHVMKILRIPFHYKKETMDTLITSTEQLTTKVSTFTLGHKNN